MLKCQFRKIFKFLVLIFLLFGPSAWAKNTLHKIDLWRGKGGTTLRGVNIHQSHIADLNVKQELGSTFTQEDFKQMSELGINYVNISHAGPYSEKHPFKLDQRILKNLDSLIDMIGKADMFAVISIRTGPGRSELTFLYGEDKTADPKNGWFSADLYNDTVWTDKKAQAAWGHMWRTLAQRYRGNPIVVGYDLMVEPNANEILLKISDGKTFYEKYKDTGYDWNSWYPDLVKSIRSVDKETPILVQAMGYGRADWIPYLKKHADPKIIYTVHQYEPYAYTHQESKGNTYPGNFDANRDGKADKVDRDFLLGVFAPLDNFTKSNKGSPVAVNEFGVKRYAVGADLYISDTLDLFEERGWNYALWAWYSGNYMSNNPPGQAYFDFRFGPDLKNGKSMSNSFQNVFLKRLKLNRARPSNTKFQNFKNKKK